MIKNSIITLLLWVSFLTACSQQAGPRLIIRGDDMGYTHSGNLALIKCYKEGIETSIEVIVPSPWFPEAVKMLEENPGVDVGVHLAITSEWDNVKWRPLTDCKSIRDADGYFFPFIHDNPNYPGRSVRENKWKLEDIEKEFRAQIEMALKKIKGVSHISGHMGCTDLAPEVKEMARRLAKEYKIDIDLADHMVQYVTYDGPKKTVEEKKASFIRMLTNLKAGNTYMFLDHPGLDDEELRAVSHVGYENVAEDRQGVTTLWTDSEVKKIIKEKGIELISYRDLTRK
jgi:predicted glycoside hydrolase/deacetylase ChbG (UPF0249 family)